MSTTRSIDCAAMILVGLLSTAVWLAAQDKPAKPEAVSCGKINKLSRIGTIYVGGQPGKEDFAELKKLSIRTILNFRKAGEVDLDERALAEQHGFRYVHLPFQKPEELTDAIFDQARKLMGDPKARPILVHCGSANRAAAVWLPYRVLDEGVPYAQAVKEAYEMGLRSVDYEKRAQDYIARHSQK
ncbi:hypothetical protein HRbin36_00492 [bacterium HR36]|nr:hypothetical protein HRbin36_00492 [bacterium HR36]